MVRLTLFYPSIFQLGECIEITTDQEVTEPWDNNNSNIPDNESYPDHFPLTPPDEVLVSQEQTASGKLITITIPDPLTEAVINFGSLKRWFRNGLMSQSTIFLSHRFLGVHKCSDELQVSLLKVII